MAQNWRDWGCWWPAACLPFGPGPGLGLVAALPAIWSDLTTDAGDKGGLAHPASQEKFKGGAGGGGGGGVGVMRVKPDWPMW